MCRLFVMQTLGSEDWAIENTVPHSVLDLVFYYSNISSSLPAYIDRRAIMRGSNRANESLYVWVWFTNIHIQSTERYVCCAPNSYIYIPANKLHTHTHIHTLSTISINSPHSNNPQNAHCSTMYNCIMRNVACRITHTIRTLNNTHSQAYTHTRIHLRHGELHTNCAGPCANKLIEKIYILLERDIWNGRKILLFFKL